MPTPRRLELGWCPDVPDFRDFDCFPLPFNGPEQPEVDLREEGLEPNFEACSGSDASCSLALLAMIDWQARKWSGKSIDASAGFLHQLTQQFAGGGGPHGVSLRSTLKTLIQFGAPPKRMWPDLSGSVESQSSHPALFGFVRQFDGLKYLRLDAWTYRRFDCLASIRRWIAQGNPCVLGFAVPSMLFFEDTHTIPFGTDHGRTVGGSACIVLGYDDHAPLQRTISHPLVSDTCRQRGALLIKTCWGADWGHEGYGWLPYAFIESRLARDAWAVTHPEWF